MTGAAGRMVGGGVRSSAGSDETPRPKAASNPRGDSFWRSERREKGLPGSGFALWATPGQAPFETTFKRSKGLPGRSSKRSFERSLVEAVGIDHAEGRGLWT